MRPYRRRDMEPCRLGYVEYDGDRYCFAHGGFTHEYGPHPMQCDRAVQLNTCHCCVGSGVVSGFDGDEPCSRCDGRGHLYPTEAVKG